MRREGGATSPRKYGFIWFMPALVSSNVGSPCGTSEELGTTRWPFERKKSRYCCRISLPRIGLVSPLVGPQVGSRRRGPHRRVHLGDGYPLLSSDAQAVVVFWRRAQPTVEGFYFDPDRPPRRLDRARPALRFVAAHPLHAHAKRAGLGQDDPG